MTGVARANDPPRRGGSGGNARGAQRRLTIYRALHDCVIERGFSRTTLADIAARAGMSASHLLYYFDGKEAILARYFAHVASTFLDQIGSRRHAPVDEQIDHLADLWFLGRSSATTEIGFMLECFGIAVHDEAMHATKTDFDRRCRDYLGSLLVAASDPADTGDAAQIAYSLMIGLRSAVYFDSSLTATEARRIFRNTLRRLAQLDEPAPPGTDAPSHSDQG
jgi:AcrR family transcriptional regulator